MKPNSLMGQSNSIPFRTAHTTMEEEDFGGCVPYLGWVAFDLDILSSCKATQPNLPISSLANSLPFYCILNNKKHVLTG